MPVNPRSDALPAAQQSRAALDLAERAALKAQTRLRAALDALPEGIVFLDEEGRYILWNKRYAEIYHRSADLFAPGAKLADTLRVGVQRGDYPEAVGREEAWLAERLNMMANPGPPHEQRLADGRWILIEERRTDDGGNIGIRVDITELKQREESFRLLFDANPVPMFLYEARSLSIVAANKAAVDHYGYSAFQLKDMSVLTLYDGEEHEALRRAMGDRPAQLPDGMWRHRKRDGAQVEVTLFQRELEWGGKPAVLLAAVDVTERRRAEARVAHMARHDALTSLPNRTLHRERVEALLAASKSGEDSFALVLIDLDHFKTVNDTLGHSVGDRLLQEVAVRLQLCVGTADMVARLGGDEFAVIHAGADRDAVITLVERMAAEVNRPYVLDGHQVLVGASFGIAMAPSDGDDPDRLLKSADLALYKAKGEGRGMFRFFEETMDNELQARLKLETELRAAIAQGELSPHYQPLVNLESGRVCGFEALVRWNHPERGIVPPGEFIPLAEEIGLIGAIGKQVLNQACRDAASWPEDIKIAVNLSPVQFKTTNLTETVVQALANSGLSPHRLDLEITEALLMDKDGGTLATLNGLRSLGVGISMDDFGTGYSSLSYLRSFPFTKIKIDQSFVRDLATSADSQAIVRAILSLGSSLGMTVTAEGVERPEDLDYLRQEGCAEGQGYYFSAARTAEEVLEMVGGPRVQATEATPVEASPERRTA